MLRKVIQFGDSINSLFVFTPFEEEEEWSDSVEVSTVETPFNDGAYRARGLDQSKKEVKTITKRFALYSPELVKNPSYFEQRKDGLKNPHMKSLIDYMYRGLRGGVKRLYALMEDGTIRYTYAEATNIPQEIRYQASDSWVYYSVDFMITDPYWYDVNDGQTLFFKNITMNDIVYSLKNKTNVLDYLDNYVDAEKISVGQYYPELAQCQYNGVILRDYDFVNYVKTGCVAEDCVQDIFAISQYGQYISVSGDTTVELFAGGNAGVPRPRIGFWNAWNNPSVFNQENGSLFEYNGNINYGEYLVVDLDSNLSGNIEDLRYITNITNFDVENITINNDGFWDLEWGYNNIVASGATGESSYFTIRNEDKYHN